jgi:hypothetical protein
MQPDRGDRAGLTLKTGACAISSISSFARGIEAPAATVTCAARDGVPSSGYAD